MSLFSLTTVGETLRIAAPYACAAVAGVWAERAGVVQIGLEAILLSSAFASVVGTLASGSAIVGVCAGFIMGVCLSAAHATLVHRTRIDAVVCGIAWNLLAYSGTRLGLRALYDSASNSPSIAAFRIGPTGNEGWQVLARVLCDPLSWLAFTAVVASPYVLNRTRLGLRIRAVGENPTAARAAGIDVGRTRLLALCISGAIGSLGGIHLAFDQHRFEAGMSAGRGFIALAAVVLSGWLPGRAALACVAFAFLEALQFVLQDIGQASKAITLAQMLPYAAVLVALGLGVGRRSAPGGLGRHAEN